MPVAEFAMCPEEIRNPVVTQWESDGCVIAECEDSSLAPAAP